MERGLTTEQGDGTCQLYSENLKDFEVKENVSAKNVRKLQSTSVDCV